MKLSNLVHSYKTLAAIMIFPAMTGLLIWLVEHRNRPASATLIVKWTPRLEFTLLQDLTFILGGRASTKNRQK
jgi:cytosine/uracil/thiamine/allantoin permease